MDSKKLKVNLEKLRLQIPKKPIKFTTEFPKTVGESLNIYLRQRTISIMLYAGWIYDRYNWPMPLYIDPMNIRIGYLNEFMFTKLGMNDFRYFDMFGALRLEKGEDFEMPRNFLTRFMWVLRYRKRKKLEYYDYLIVPLICRFFGVSNIDTFNIELFTTNYHYLKKRVSNHPSLSDKKPIIEEIFINYKKGNYYSCISTLYPILDFLIRQYFDTKDFGKDLTSVNAIFKAAGFDQDEIDNLKPGAAFQKKYELIRLGVRKHEDFDNQADPHDYGLGMAGVALSSFLIFSSHYYAYYRSDKGSANMLNRHSILHGSNNSFGTRTNAIKLITYLYLALELEPVLKILFKNK